RGRRTIGHAGNNNIVHSLRDDAVLKHRFIEIVNVIADNVAFETLLGCIGIRKTGKSGEGADVVGESKFSAIGGGKSDSSFRRHVVNDLAHAATFIGCVRWTVEVLKYDYRLRVGGVAG